MRKNIFVKHTIIVLLYFSVNKLLAQTDIKKFNYTFNSGIGAYNPLINNAKLASTGLLFSFQLQANYKTKYFSRITFSQFSLSYKDNFAVNGLNIKIEDRLETLTLGLDAGYVFFQKNKFNTYALVGASSAAMFIPKIQYNSANTDSNISKQLNFFPLFNAGIGLEYKLSKLVILSAEIQYVSIPFKTELSSKQFNGIISQLNFKTNF